MKPYNLLLLISALLLSGCDKEMVKKEREWVDPKAKYYVDFERFKEGRPCADVRFECLPESRDRSWQEQSLGSGLDTFELTPEVMKRYRAIIQRWRDEEEGKIEEQSMNIALLSEEFFDRVEEKIFLEEMEERLEKEFPGFWRDVPKPVRYRWIRRAMNKAKKLGYNESKPNGIIELCARIGLDFDLDPKWESMVNFLSLPNASKLGYDIVALEYIDFTIFNKNTDAYGRPITDWSLRDTFGYLPRPKRPLPRLNDN